MPNTLSLNSTYLPDWEIEFAISKRGELGVELSCDGYGELTLSVRSVEKLRDFLIEQYPIEAPKPPPRYELVSNHSTSHNVFEVADPAPAPAKKILGSFSNLEDAKTFLKAKQAST